MVNYSQHFAAFLFQSFTSVEFISDAYLVSPSIDELIVPIQAIATAKEITMPASWPNVLLINVCKKTKGLCNNVLLLFCLHLFEKKPILSTYERYSR